jgi:hypothetical protein
LDKVPLPPIYYPVTFFNLLPGNNILFSKGISLIYFNSGALVPNNFYKNNYIINIFDPIGIYRPVTLFNYL